MGRGALLVRQVALPDGRLDSLPLQIGKGARMEGPGRACQAVHLDGCGHAGFWKSAAASRAVAAGVSAARPWSKSADRRVTTTQPNFNMRAAAGLTAKRQSTCRPSMI